MNAWLAAFLFVAGAAPSQTPDAGDTGPLLKVPSPETALFFKTQPVVIEGKVLVPQAAIDRWLRTKPDRPAEGQLAYTYFGGTDSAVRIHLWLGEKRVRIAQAEIPLEIAPRAIDGVVFLPLKFMAEALGVWVEQQGRRIVLSKPDLGWTSGLAIPPHPKSLEGKMTALAVARRPEGLKRVVAVMLSPDTLAGFVAIAEPSDDGTSAAYHTAHYTRDATGWRFTHEAPIAPPPGPGD